MGKFSEAHLKNSLDFRNRLENFALENDMSKYKMVSFDVVALFTSVPVDMVLDFLRRKYSEGLFQPPLDVEVFLGLVKLCVTSCKFEFKGVYFEQIFGCPMGGASHLLWLIYSWIFLKLKF